MLDAIGTLRRVEHAPVGPSRGYWLIADANDEYVDVGFAQNAA
jgi:hypothetical protein